MKRGRLDEIEKRARALLDDQSFVSVTFSNGQRRTMRLCDVIPLLKENETGLSVTDVTGEARPGDGKLLELIQGIAREKA